MIPQARRRLLPAAFVLALVASACAPAASFDPTGECSGDGQAVGAYPEIEALVPAAFRDRPADRLDSGRSCTEQNLGTLAEQGVEELRFAGGLWELSDQGGITLAVFTAEGLRAEWMGEFYETGARAGRKTEDVQVRRFEIGGREAVRIDTLNDESFQSIVVWDGPQSGVVRAVLVGNEIREIETRAAHDAIVEAGISAFSG